MDFNEKIKKLRTDKGLTQEKLAEKLCVTRSAVSKWESGASYPSIDVIKDMSALFNLPIDGLLSGEEISSLKKTEKPTLLKRSAHVFFAVADVLSVLLVVLPLFAKVVQSGVDGVPLYFADSLGVAVKTAIYIALSLSSVIGITETVMLFKNAEKGLYVLAVISLSVQTVALLVFAVARQPYLSAITLLFLAVKIVLSVIPLYKSIKL